MEKIPYIKDREDLFETKVLRMAVNEGTADADIKQILVATRDAGSSNALIPALKELVADRNVQVDVVTDGLAQEKIQDNFATEDITPPDRVLDSDSVIGTPDVILFDRSEETGIDNYVTATFPEVPKVLVEDVYGNALPYLLDLQKRDLPLPEKICVMDKGAKEIIVAQLPELADSIVVTGQPAFDRFAHEDTEKISQETRTKLGLKTKDKLVVYMSSIDEPEKIKKMAAALKESEEKFYFVLRRHPKDNTSYDTYKEMLTQAGMEVIDTDSFTTDEIGAAADVVLTTWSTEGVNAIYRRKPTAHITDHNFAINVGYALPLVPVRLGASVGLDDVNELKEILPQLLDGESGLNQRLRERMQQEYRVDGKNAQRVADVVREYLKE